MTATLQQLDAAIAQLTTTDATILSDVQALVSKLQQPGADYSSELAAVQGAISQLQSADVTAQGALNPAPTQPATPDQAPADGSAGA